MIYKPVDKPTSDTETATTGELFPAQNNGGADQHHGGEDHQQHDVHVGDTTLINNLEARPVRKKKPNSGTMARWPTHVEQPARHSPANRPRERCEFHLSKLSSLLFLPCIISEHIEYFLYRFIKRFIWQSYI